MTYAAENNATAVDRESFADDDVEDEGVDDEINAQNSKAKIQSGRDLESIKGNEPRRYFRSPLTPLSIPRFLSLCSRAASRLVPLYRTNKNTQGALAAQ